ncbi:cupin domain-containing protein [Cupriavidus sp. WKF15]|uniref:cupin domain-containing protein n=1 Tax=Cupriavidus sp. WKF15 TaxID=3032282 RepID=UPI0023E25203|nr:cupin domain-containing protein [Cupriavidus sp. WKF15]WER47963.1 cupin domain-containing protein [Cupriavidus sp. WKF15]
MNVVTTTSCTRWSPMSAAPEGDAFHAGLIGKEYTDAYTLGLARLQAHGQIGSRISSHNQAFFVMEGKGVASLAGAQSAFCQGAVIKIPRGVRHAIRNAEATPMWLLAIHDTPMALEADASGPDQAPDLACRREAEPMAKHAPEVMNADAMAWRAFEAPGVQGYELKPMLVGEEHSDAYSVDLMRVAAGGFSAAHTDLGRHAFVILAGQGRLTVDGEPIDFRQGDIVKVPTGSLHAVHNVGGDPLEFLAIYDPPRRRKAG